MSDHSLYDALRHIADSYGLIAMMAVFVVLVAWPFRPGARDRNDEAANMIFKDENDG
ncbi:cbb3-type cytochrome c oxidase subunit 3 [Croceicoccus naphthovorans]|uniref:Cbb3-type cytochrome oxidase subunit 3 n=1 Tax=Croceicoccus naphthovorans TaxID=1348774 RepID=A0A0G3XG08_9SPHN|nr:cbb3-type cytochrome c oxidase subunit 3 [Croceicoccus naphthovorans]AKM09524.1 Cbb3-type cytochrome oxidase subunit 3 [Croceicoccus naphthovorans]MBB3989728.1 cytochrome c oxidase cbb3-type subunit 4 [Croceicoccus naphthovorans]